MQRVNRTTSPREWLTLVHKAIAGGKRVQQLGAFLKKERVFPLQLLETCRQISSPVSWQIRRSVLEGIAGGIVDVHQIDSEINAAKIDKLTAERDEARTEAAQARAQLAQSQPLQTAGADTSAQKAESPEQLDFMGVVQKLFEEGPINQNGLDQLKDALKREVSIRGPRADEIETLFQEAARFDRLTSDQAKYLLSQIGEVLEIVGLAGSADAARIAEQIAEFVTGGQQ